MAEPTMHPFLVATLATFNREGADSRTPAVTIDERLASIEARLTGLEKACADAARARLVAKSIIGFVPSAVTLDLLMPWAKCGEPPIKSAEPDRDGA